VDPSTIPKKKEGVMSMKYFLFNYGKYHNNSVNQIIHVIFIPTILFTLFVMLCHSMPWITLDFKLPLIGNQINSGAALIFALQLGYFMVDVITAFMFTLWSTACVVYGQHLYFTKDTQGITVGDHTYTLLYWITALHIASWIMQFYGHGVHEGRAPALLDNLGFTLLAPFFATFEVINFVFGYYEGHEMDGIRKDIAEEIRAYRSKGKTQ
jgi:uncharacterized membrane protein YGL010W